MRNTFYSQFDTASLFPRQREDYRSPFQRERDRIIHSSALRRLQSKTQVFHAGEYDFYRTRLTHSIEVAQIGRSICQFLKHESKMFGDEFYIDDDLVESICLSHDLGHPPFGHSGESTLNQLMRSDGGFEGNAQTLRILTETIYEETGGRSGMNPSRALLDGVLKYKSLLSAADSADRYFLYDDQAQYLDFVFSGHKLNDSLEPGVPVNKFRSIECQIMDWADDTAYSLNDIVDGVNARFINLEQIEKWGEMNSPQREESQWLEQLLTFIRANNVERNFSRKIGDFITACRVEQRENFMSSTTNRYAYELHIEDIAWREALLYKKLASDIVFDSPQLRQLRYKWDRIVQKLFEAFQENYVDNEESPNQLLPLKAHQELLVAGTRPVRMRLICDQIADMTDGFAIRTYKRLFDPGFGSFLDLI